MSSPEEAISAVRGGGNAADELRQDDQPPEERAHLGEQIETVDGGDADGGRFEDQVAVEEGRQDAGQPEQRPQVPKPGLESGVVRGAGLPLASYSCIIIPLPLSFLYKLPPL